MPKALGLSFDQSVALVKTVCEVAGSRNFVKQAQAHLRKAGVLKAIQKHDDAVLFNWLMEAGSYQGISDAVAAGYMEAHGTASAYNIARDLAARPRCEKLNSYWQFNDCGYKKSQGSCKQPKLISSCPLPRIDLRNGSLNQAAFSLHMFMRDVADGDFVGWIDRRVRIANDTGSSAAHSVIDPLTRIHGLSFKVLSMAISTLLLAGDPRRPDWLAAGANLIAIDSLVHNWLHRVGILRGYDAEHAYGPGCYGTGRCADIVRAIAGEIDVSAFDATYPPNFPRWVQHSVWRFCAQTELAQCNGNNIDDSGRCRLRDCILFEDCARIKLGRSTTAK